MTRKITILAFALCAFSAAVLFSACGTTSTAPLDDAYFWPDGRAQATNEPSTNDQRPATNMEILDEQDNSVTVRVKK